MQSTTQFPDGTSLTIKFKKDIDPSQIISDYNGKAEEIADKNTAIEKLRKKRENAGTPHEALKITEQIKAWNELPSMFTLTDELILTVGVDWDLKDAESGEPKPFDLQSVKQVHFTRKLKVAEQIIKDLGFDMSEMTDPKESLSKSKPPLLSASTEASNSPNGQE